MPTSHVRVCRRHALRPGPPPGNLAFTHARMAGASGAAEGLARLLRICAAAPPAPANQRAAEPHGRGFGSVNALWQSALVCAALKRLTATAAPPYAAAAPGALPPPRFAGPGAPPPRPAPHSPPASIGGCAPSRAAPPGTDGYGAGVPQAAPVPQTVEGPDARRAAVPTPHAPSRTRRKAGRPPRRAHRGDGGGQHQTADEARHLLRGGFTQLPWLETRRRCPGVRLSASRLRAGVPVGQQLLVRQNGKWTPAVVAAVSRAHGSVLVVHRDGRLQAADVCVTPVCWPQQGGERL